MTSRTTARTKARVLGRKEHGGSGSSAIPTTTSSWVGQLECYIWGRRTYELSHRAHSQSVPTYFAAPAQIEAPEVTRSRGVVNILRAETERWLDGYAAQHGGGQP